MVRHPGIKFLNIPNNNTNVLKLGKFNKIHLDSHNLLNDRELVLTLTNLPHLKTLFAGQYEAYLGANPRQTAKAFRAAVPQLLQLSTLLVGKKHHSLVMTPLNAADLRIISNSSTKITNLRLSLYEANTVCCELDNSAIKVIVEGLPHLVELEVQYNQIGIEGVKNILEGLVDLRQLYLGTEGTIQVETYLANRKAPRLLFRLQKCLTIWDCSIVEQDLPS